MGGTFTAEAAFDDGSVIVFKDRQARVEQFAPGDDDDVEAGSDVVSPKDLANQSFRPVPLNGPAQLLRRRDAEPAGLERVRQDEHRGVAAVNLEAARVDLLEIGAASDPFAPVESLGCQLLAAHCETLAALGPAPLQHEPAVFRAHANQEPVRAPAAAPVRLECALPLHDTLSE